MASDYCSAIIISASSDIGTAIGQSWLARGWKVFGTFRTRSQAVHDLQGQGATLVHCDLSDLSSIEGACSKIRALCPYWDILVFCPGTQDPVGAFSAVSFEQWAASIQVNFVSQMRITHALLPTRNIDATLGPCVLLFAGGGTNNATSNYSAYTVSKIALIKMCELLDTEVSDTRFAIVGPGWVKTKIHMSTLAAGSMAGDNYDRTRVKLASYDCVPLVAILDCLDWIIKAPRESISGRNISLVHDDWGNPDLEALLRDNPDMYKLRRSDNSRLVRHLPITDQTYRGPSDD